MGTNNNHLCHLCNGELIPYGIGKLKCKFCDTIYEEEVINGEEGILLVDAYKQLRDGETDEAYKSFIDIIDRSPKCYEAFFGVALANHGIVYVDDSRGDNRKRVPTCYNTTLTPFREDSYYQKAIETAPPEIREKYEKDAAEIDRIREHWVQMAAKEKPYDIFISFKDTDDVTKKRTEDSVQAQEIYTWLTDQGYRVFYSRTSLADKISENYEPYIYNALQTAKVMIVYGQKAEYFNAYWVRNEWRRWWKRIDGGDKHPQSLVVAYENMNAYDIPKTLLRGGMMALDASKKDFFPLLLSHIKKIFASLEAKSGNVRVELAGFNGKRATKIEGEKIAKKQLGSGVKKANKAVAAGAVTVREIGVVSEEKELAIEDSKALSLGNAALSNKRYKKALEYYAQVLQSGDNAEAHIGTMFASLNVNTDKDFVLRSSKFEGFSHFDGVMASCTQAQLDRVANFFCESEEECFKNNNIEKGIGFFEKLVAYNIPQRDKALKIIVDKLNDTIGQSVSVAARLSDVYFEAIASEDADKYIRHCSEVVDKAIECKNYTLAESVNGRIGKVDENADIFIFNKIRLEVKSTLKGKSVLDIYKLAGFSEIDNLLSNVTKQSANTYNRLLVNAVFMGLSSVYTGKNAAIKNKVVELFKIIISYTYEVYYLYEKNTDEAGFKFAFFTELLLQNALRRVYTEQEIGALKEHILKTLDENAVDEYAAYELAQAVYFMRISAFSSAKKALARSLELIPNDSNARILDMCCTYEITLKDVKRARGELNEKLQLSASNALLYALIEKAYASATEDLTKHFENLLKYCKKEDDWRKDSQSEFYVSHMQGDIYYGYLASFKPAERTSAVFATIARENLDYKYEPRTQYDYVIKIFTDEIVNFITDTGAKKEVIKLTDLYYKLLKYIDAGNKTFMCERLKFMGDFLLAERYFDLAEKFYTYAISENQLDGELYWKRLHAKFGAVNTIDLILSKKRVEPDEDFNSVLKLVDESEVEKYLQVPNKQEYLLSHRSFKSLLNKKKNFIPASDVNRLFVCGDDEFKKYLKELDETEQQAQEKRKKERAHAVAKSGIAGVAILIFLISLVFVAAEVLAAVKFEVIYNIVKLGDSADRQMHLANKAALIVTAAIAFVLQIVHVAKLQKTKLGVTIIAQIAVMGLIVLSDFVLVQTFEFSDLIAWSAAVGMVGFMINYTIWQATADMDFPEDAWLALGKSLSTYVIAAAFTVLPMIFKDKLTVAVQILLAVLMVAGVIAGIAWDLIDDMSARAWITAGIYVASQIVLSIVFAIVGAIFQTISIGGIVVGVIVIVIGIFIIVGMFAN